MVEVGVWEVGSSVYRGMSASVSAVPGGADDDGLPEAGRGAGAPRGFGH